jgi:hypothetical protein
MILRLRHLPVFCVILAVWVTLLLRDRLAAAEDAGAGAAAAELAAAVDAGQPPVAPPPSLPVAATPKPPADPVAHPGDALDGFRLWLKTGWPMAILFALGSVLVALGARVKQLQKGKAAIVTATATAAIVAFLGAKAAGMSGAQAMSGTLSVLLGGVFWFMKPNQATLDLSTATPDKIAAALIAANKPPAFPTSGGPA